MGRYPPAYVAGPDGRPWHSWRVLILPFLEQDELHKEYDFAEPWDGPNNRRLAGLMPKTFAFTGAGRPGRTTTNYLAVVGEGTVWPGRTSVSREDVTDDPGETVLIVENQGAEVHWMEPRDLAFADMDFRLNTPGGVGSRYDDPAVAMLDGSVQRLRPAIQPDTLRALLTIRGGEPFRSDGPGGWELLPDGRERPLRRQ